MMPKGWADKLYWRPVGPRRYCCFKKLAEPEKQGGIVYRYISLCGGGLKGRSGGQAIQRPPFGRRCIRCNELEMKRRGWDEPGPARPAS